VVPPTTSSSASIPADLSAFYSQSIAWHDCGGPECARIDVPLDYADPSGPTISLSLSRTKATGSPIGTLFINPGGPGGSAVDYAKAAALFGAIVDGCPEDGAASVYLAASSLAVVGDLSGVETDGALVLREK
jgi:hypothetical protein